MPTPPKPIADPNLQAALSYCASLPRLPKEEVGPAIVKIRAHMALALGADTARVARVYVALREAGAVLRRGEREAIHAAWVRARADAARKLKEGREALAFAHSVVPTDDPEAAAELRALYRLAKKC